MGHHRCCLAGTCPPTNYCKLCYCPSPAAEKRVSQYTITYFDVRGRSGATRFLLADQGCEWKEEVVSLQDWIDGKVDLKKTAVFGQLPMFADGDFILFQSKAILRYLGRKHDVYGKNDKEAALIDMANDGVEDLREKFYRCYFFEWDTGKEKYMEDLPNQLRAFERLLSQNSSGFLVGSTVSFADYNLLDLLHNHLVYVPDCLNSFPHLKAFKEKMECRPKLKAYLQSNDHKNRIFLPPLSRHFGQHPCATCNLIRPHFHLSRKL